MEEQQRIAKLFGRLVQSILQSGSKTEDTQVYLQEISDLYVSELERRPRQLLANLRDTEVRIRRELGKGYYREFARRIQDVPFANRVLAENLGAEQNLQKLLRSVASQWGSSTFREVHFHSKKIIRPRHFLYYLTDTSHTHLDPISISLLIEHGSRLTDHPSDSVIFTTKNRWVHLPMQHPTEEQLDEHFVRFVKSQKALERSVQSELAGLVGSTRAAVEQVREINADIEALVGYFEQTEQWKMEFLERWGNATPGDQ